MAALKYTEYCPVCGFHLGFKPWDDGSGSQEICPSCGIQFGYSDAAGGNEEGRKYLYKGWRLKWKVDGMRWSSPNEPPFNWDPQEQLKNIPKEFLSPGEKY